MFGNRYEEINMAKQISSKYCPISFNSNKGVTCDHLFKILVSNTSQKEGDRVQPDTCPPPNWTLNCLIWYQRLPVLWNKGHVTQDKCDISNKLSKTVMCDIWIEWNGTVPICIKLSIWLISFVGLVYMVYLIVKIHNWAINAIRMASPQSWAILISLAGSEPLRVAWSCFDWLSAWAAPQASWASCDITIFTPASCELEILKD